MTRPALGELVLSARGIGDIVLGRPVPVEAPDLSPVVWDGERCQEPGYPADGRWLPAEGDPARPAFWIITADPAAAESPVQQVGVASAELATAGGTRVGSTRAELEAQEPAAEVRADGDLSDLYVVTGPDGSIAFEVAKPYMDYWSQEDIDRVVSIWITDASIEPMTRSGSGAAGYCFT